MCKCTPLIGTVVAIIYHTALGACQEQLAALVNWGDSWGCQEQFALAPRGVLYRLGRVHCTWVDTVELTHYTICRRSTVPHNPATNGGMQNGSSVGTCVFACSAPTCNAHPTNIASVNLVMGCSKSFFFHYSKTCPGALMLYK